MIRIANLLPPFKQPLLPIGTASNPIPVGNGLRLSVTGTEGDYFIQDTNSRIRYRLPRKHRESTIEFLTDVANGKCHGTAGGLLISFVRFGHHVLAVSPETAQGLLWGLEILKNGPVQEIPSHLIQTGRPESAPVVS